MHVFESAEQLIATEPGTALGSSDWLEVTQEMVDLFADATHDHQWIHVDPERAARGPYGTTIAHGYLTLSLLPVLINQVYDVPWASRRVNVGSDRVRFVAPVPVGSRVRASVELAGVEPRDGSVRITFDTTIELEGSDRPAAVVRSIGQAFA